MDAENIITAPVITDVNSILEIWQRDHVGSASVFYEFITTPSVERDEFLCSLDEQGMISISFQGNVAELMLKS